MDEVKTYTAIIFIAGDYLQAKQVCREFCRRGLCVTIEPTCYIYTGGEESGVRVGLINYPRFPSDEATIIKTALELAELLRQKLCQQSYSIVTPTKTIWESSRA